ncbi:MAG: hypothetical protein QOJ92_873 [Frankiales bacterium]|nr:hypothetical protein [Frankiales bacterium]
MLNTKRVAIAAVGAVALTSCGYAGAATAAYLPPVPSSSGGTACMDDGDPPPDGNLVVAELHYSGANITIRFGLLQPAASGDTFILNVIRANGSLHHQYKLAPAVGQTEITKTASMQSVLGDVGRGWKWNATTTHAGRSDSCRVVLGDE